MRFEVGTVNAISRAVLAVAMTACGFWIFGPQTGLGNTLVVWDTPLHFVAGYALTILSFASFPRLRRMDLFKVAILAGALVELARHLVGYPVDPANVTAYLAGAVAVLIPSFIERFRALTRVDPHEPFSMVMPNDRRRRRSEVSNSAAESEYTSPPALNASPAREEG